MSFDKNAFKSVILRFRKSLLRSAKKLKVADSFKLNGLTLDDVSTGILNNTVGTNGLGLMGARLDFTTSVSNVLCQGTPTEVYLELQGKNCRYVVGDAYSHLSEHNLTSIALVPSPPRISSDNLDIKGTLEVKCGTGYVERTFTTGLWSTELSEWVDYKFTQFSLTDPLNTWGPWHAIKTSRRYPPFNLTLEAGEHLIYEPPAAVSELVYFIDGSVESSLSMANENRLNADKKINFATDCVITFIKKGVTPLIFDQLGLVLLRHSQGKVLSVTNENSKVTFTRMGLNSWYVEGDLDNAPEQSSVSE